MQLESQLKLNWFLVSTGSSQGQLPPHLLSFNQQRAGTGVVQKEVPILHLKARFSQHPLVPRWHALSPALSSSAQSLGCHSTRGLTCIIQTFWSLAPFLSFSPLSATVCPLSLSLSLSLSLQVVTPLASILGPVNSLESRSPITLL